MSRTGITVAYILINRINKVSASLLLLLFLLIVIIIIVIINFIPINSALISLLYARDQPQVKVLPTELSDTTPIIKKIIFAM